MTGPEAKKQDLLFEFVKEWREDDREWKGDVSERLRAVETYITTDEARNKATDSAAAKQRRLNIDRRALVAMVISAVAGLGGLLIGAVNLLSKLG